MESKRERRTRATHRFVAIILTLAFHLALFGGIYYAMQPETEQIEVQEDLAEKKTAAKQARS